MQELQNVTTYVESAAGIELVTNCLTALVVAAICFAISSLLALVMIVPTTTAPILIVVGISDVEWLEKYPLGRYVRS